MSTISENQQESKKSTEWGRRDQLDYYLFIFLKYSKFQKKGKKTNIFVQMTNFLKNKTPTQCRSHNQNMLEKTKTYLKMLTSFYYNQYIIHQFEIEKLKKDVSILVRNAINNNKISSKQYGQLMDDFQKNLSILNLQQKFQKQHTAIRDKTKKITMATQCPEIQEKQDLIRNQVPSLQYQNHTSSVHPSSNRQDQQNYYNNAKEIYEDFFA